MGATIYKAIPGLEDVDVKTTTPAGVNLEQLKKIKKVAVLIGGSSSQSQMLSPFGSDITHVMADNISLELMNMGYEVIERAELDKVFSEYKLKMSGTTMDSSSAKELGKIVGVDAFVLGHVSAGSQMQIVSNATMRIIGVNDGKTLMIITLSYKKGKPPTEASKTMAKALSETLKYLKEKKGEQPIKESKHE